MPKKKHTDYGTKIPRHEIEALALVLYDDLIAFFEREDVQKEYAEWEKQQDAKKE